MEYHTCTTCGILKTEDSFYKRSHRPKKVTSSCKECRKRKSRQDWTPRQQREYRLLSTFGISLDDYEKMAKSQGYVCAICNKKESAKSKTGYVKSLAVDHCHDTGKIRGLLCQNCNTGIGKFKDDTDLLQSAIQYLKEGL